MRLDSGSCQQHSWRLQECPLSALHHLPVFCIDFHGSASGSASPAYKISTLISSGERTNAMRPSRGGRLMVTPASISFWQVS